VLIRRAVPGDVEVIADVHQHAFAGPAEAALAGALHTGGHVVDALSLVAVVPDHHDAGPVVGHVVGHVACSRGWVAGRAVLGLGPLGVRPEHQHLGIGTGLMHAVIAAADALDEPLIALLGEPAFYSRFGFLRSTDVGIAAPDPGWGPYFQVRLLTSYDPAITGAFRYAPPFDDL
jgi:putative acetyltransferase